MTGTGLVDEMIRMYEERKRLTPEKGYNIVVMEEYKPSLHGKNRLTLLKHVDTWNQALKELADFKKIFGDEKDNLMIYPTKRKEESADEFNPYHDDLGRFTDADYASTISVDGDNKFATAFKKDLAARAIAVEKIITAMTDPRGNPVTATDAKTSAQIDAIRQGLMTLSPRDLEKLYFSGGVMLDNKLNKNGQIETPGYFNGIPLPGTADGFYIQSTSPDAQAWLDKYNEFYGTKYKAGTIVMGGGKTEEMLYSFTVHEVHHTKWDSITQDYQSLSPDRLASKTIYTQEPAVAKKRALDNFVTEYRFAMNQHQNSFALAFGSYGTLQYGSNVGRKDTSSYQEGYTTMAQAFYTNDPWYNYSDKSSGVERPAATSTNEHYFDTVRNLFPELEPVMQRWAELETITGGDQEIIANQ